MLITLVAVLVILIGLLQLSGLPIPGISRRTHLSADRGSMVSVFLLGPSYAVAGVCTGPILGSVQVMASLGSSAVYSGVLLAVYAIGMVAPLLGLTLLWRAFGGRAMRWLRPRMLRIGRWESSWTAIITGALSVGLGIFLLATHGTASLGGVLVWRRSSGAGSGSGAESKDEPARSYR